MQKHTQKAVKDRQKRADKCKLYNRFLKTDLRNIFLEIWFALITKDLDKGSCQQ